MKKIIFLIAGLVLTGFTATATTTEKISFKESTFSRGYGNSFIFVEDGIEFSIFRDGQFDFNILRNNSRLNVSIGSPNVNISFNSGYNYNAYVQYDEYGAIIQIENTPIYYDYYGRVNQIGRVNISYNHYGHLNRVGGLHVYYNRNRSFSHYSGFINIYNRRYVYRPWHRYYRVPAYEHCVVYNRPYRKHYAPIRYAYKRPFYNNYRPRTAIATRRGSKIHRNRSYATAHRSARNRTHITSGVNYRREATQTTTRNRNTALNTNRSSRVHSQNINRRSAVKNENIRSKNVRNTANNTRANLNRNTVNHSNKQRTNARNRKTEVTKKPNSINSRRYNKISNTTRKKQDVAPRTRSYQPKTAQRTVTRSSKPKSTQRSVSRSVQSKQRAIQSRNTSSNNNTRSTSRRGS